MHAVAENSLQHVRATHFGRDVFFRTLARWVYSKFPLGDGGIIANATSPVNSRWHTPTCKQDQHALKKKFAGAVLSTNNHHESYSRICFSVVLCRIAPEGRGYRSRIDSSPAASCWAVLGARSQPRKPTMVPMAKESRMVSKKQPLCFAVVFRGRLPMGI